MELRTKSSKLAKNLQKRPRSVNTYVPTTYFIFLKTVTKSKEDTPV